MAEDGTVSELDPSAAPTTEPPYFIRNLAAYAAQTGDLPETAQVVRAVTLFRSMALSKTHYPHATTFPNELAAAACMGRAVRQLDAAMALLAQGFHAEVTTLLRCLYESVGLGRVLAKDRENSSERAVKWLEQGTWWPERAVRKWLEETRFVEEPQIAAYRNYYSEASDWTHPTRQS